MDVQGIPETEAVDGTPDQVNHLKKKNGVESHGIEWLVGCGIYGQKDYETNNVQNNFHLRQNVL